MSLIANVSLKFKLFGSFLTALLITVIIGVAGFWSIRTGNEIVNDIATNHLSLLINAEQLQILSLNHRRYEKDFFLNIGKPEKQQDYIKKFKEISDTTNTTIDKIIARANQNQRLSDDVKAKINKTRESYSAYYNGFLNLTEKVSANQNLTPQEANKLMGPIKDAIYEFEDGISALVTEAEKIINEVTTDQISQGQKSQNLILLFLAIGFLVSVFLSFFTSLVIIRPIKRVISEFKISPRVKGILPCALKFQGGMKSANCQTGLTCFWIGSRH